MDNVTNKSWREGEIVVTTEEANLWTMEQDDVGDIIFVHRETQARSLAADSDVLEGQHTY